MKTDMVMYKKVYLILKNKIEFGLLPKGSRLPSRNDLCKEYNVSEKTVRKAIELLTINGYIRTEKRKRPIVIFDYAPGNEKSLQPLRQADGTAANDILKTGALLCYPLINNGISLCTGKEWEIPESIVAKMNPTRPTEFWRVSNSFWRFFILRNGNELILRTVDSLNLSEIDPLPGTYEIRCSYYNNIKKFLHIVKHGGSSKSVAFEDLSPLYGFLSNQKKDQPTYKASLDSPFYMGTLTLGEQINQAEKRYSSVYMDLLGLISVGCYKPGDRLPSHAELCTIYNVSIDTTIKAIQMLQEWGVVTTVRGKGIFAAMDLEELKKLNIDPHLIACHVRRYLDSIELLSLTAESMANHAAPYVLRTDAVKLKETTEHLWDDFYMYQLSPLILLDFLIEHIEYNAYREILRVIRKNYRIGRSIPKLVNPVKSPVSCEIHRQCIDCIDTLIGGDYPLFAERAAKMFRFTQKVIISECQRLGYYDAAISVYDGNALWNY